MTSHERHRFGGARPSPTRRLGERRTLGFRRPQPREAARRKAVRVEHEAARVDQAHDAECERLSFHLRDHGSERPPDLPETEQHYVAALGVRHRATADLRDRKSTRLNSSHDQISYAVFCLKKKKKTTMKQMDDVSLLFITQIGDIP